MEYTLTPYSSIEPFVWWNDAFTNEELNWLQNKALNANEKAKIGNGLINDEHLRSYRRSQVSWLRHNVETKWIFEKLSHVVSSINAQFYQFDLTGFGEALQLTNYDMSESGMYGWHQDCGGGGNASVSRKLSLVLQLTDPSEYEGGNLQIMIGKDPQNIKKQRGLIVAFPSYQLHQVTPVTQGHRQSLVAWISGPKFK